MMRCYFFGLLTLLVYVHLQLKLQADTFTLNTFSTQTNAGFVINGDDVFNITVTGVIDVTDLGGDAVATTGHNNVINNFGELITDNDGDNGIDVGGLQGSLSPQNNNEVNNYQRISIGGDTAVATLSLGFDNRITNRGDIELNGQTNWGMLLFGDRSEAVNTSTGHIYGFDDESVGIFTFGERDNQVVNSGEIDMIGDGTRGIFAASYIVNIFDPALTDISDTGIFDPYQNLNETEAISIDNQSGGLVSVEGDSSFAILAIANDSNSAEATGGITNRGLVQAEGSSGAAIFVIGNNVSIDNLESGLVRTLGDSAHAVQAYGDDHTILNDVNAKIETMGNASLGVRLIGNNGVIENRGLIETIANDSSGILTEGSEDPTTITPNTGTRINQLGVINTQGNHAHGIAAAIHGGTISLGTTSDPASITTMGDAAYGINLISGTDTTINSYGDITTNGDLSHAVQVAGDSHQVNLHGTITTANGWGVLVNGDGNTVTNNGTLNIGGLNTGIYMLGENNTLINTQTINTTGTFAHGAVIDGPTGASNSNTFLNTGAISTQAPSAIGIRALDATLRIDHGTSADPSATITTTGSFASGIEISNDSSLLTTVNNYGGIQTAGSLAHGIEGRSDSSIGSFGTIETTGDQARGIYSPDDFTSILIGGDITTTGTESHGVEFGQAGSGLLMTSDSTITTSGSDAYGIFVDGHDTNINGSGTITTTGSMSDAFHIVGNEHEIDYDGMINVSGFGSDAISVTGDENVVNHDGTTVASGLATAAIRIIGHDNIFNNTSLDTIRVTANDADAVVINGDNNTFTNTGTIETTGTNSRGVVVTGDNNEVTLEGKVDTQDDAVVVTGTGNTVNVPDLSQVPGDFNIDTGNTLNLSIPGSVGTIPVVRDFSGISPGVTVNTSPGTIFDPGTGQLATFNETVFVTTSRGLTEFNRAVNTSVTRQLDEEERDGEDDENEISRTSITRQATPLVIWTDIFAGFSRYDADGSVSEHHVDSYGGMMGFELPFKKNRVGVIVGYSGQQIDIESGGVKIQDIGTNGGFASIYARRQYDDFHFDFTLTTGAATNHSERQVVDTMASGGVATSEADFTSVYVATSVRVAKEFVLRQRGTKRLSLIPSFRLTYGGQWNSSYTETGASTSFIFGSQFASYIEPRTELKLRQYYQRGHVGGYVSVLTNFDVGDDTISAGIGTTSTAISVDNKTLVSGIFGGEFFYRLAGEMYLNTAIEGMVGNQGFRSAGGRIGLVFFQH